MIISDGTKSMPAEQCTTSTWTQVEEESTIFIYTCIHVHAWYDAVTVPIFWRITISLPVSVSASNGSIYASTIRPGELNH